MGKRRVSEADKEMIVRMRQKGLSHRAIGAKLGISPAAVSWYCLQLAVEPPRPGKSWDAIKGPAVMSRGNHVLRRFTPDDDARLLEMENSGATIAEIARALGRPSNSIRGRLMTLARRDERREQGEAA